MEKAKAKELQMTRASIPQAHLDEVLEDMLQYSKKLSNLSDTQWGYMLQNVVMRNGDAFVGSIILLPHQNDSTPNTPTEPQEEKEDDDQ